MFVIGQQSQPAEQTSRASQQNRPAEPASRTMLLTFEAGIHLAYQVLYRNLDVLKGDIRGPTAPYPLTVHASGADALTSLNQ